LRVNDFVIVEVFSIKGNLIADYKNINAALLELKAGVYVLKVSKGDYFTTKKIGEAMMKYSILLRNPILLYLVINLKGTKCQAHF
jgi:hypothetical protein